MSNAAAEYVHINVGYEGADVRAGVEYVHLNIGSFSIKTTLGRVYGLVHLRRHGVDYVYLNVTEV